jgi:hypothetical protein
MNLCIIGFPSALRAIWSFASNFTAMIQFLDHSQGLKHGVAVAARYQVLNRRAAPAVGNIGRVEAHAFGTL